MAVIIDWATPFGIVLALGILAMTLGLIRSESAGDLRTLAATGASSWTRRTLTGPWRVPRPGRGGARYGSGLCRRYRLLLG